MARDAAVNRKTVEGFLEVLEDLLLAFRVDVFIRRPKRQTAAHPKFHLFDAGVFRSLRPAGPMDRPSEIDGAALEGLVAQHLRAWIAGATPWGEPPPPIPSTTVRGGARDRLPAGERASG